MRPFADAQLILRALILLGLIGFGFYVAADQGLVRLALDADRSYISSLILVVYAGASLHWLWLARQLGRERRGLMQLEQAMAAAKGASASEPAGQMTVEAAQRSSALARLAECPGLLGDLGLAWQTQGSKTDADALLTAFADQLANRHALGHFLGDTLLKLGLLGTVVGFILMLMSIGDLDTFAPSQMRQLLATMSGGMAVALYTTLAGLITSTLLKLQYHLLDSSSAELATRVTVLAATETRAPR